MTHDEHGQRIRDLAAEAYECFELARRATGDDEAGPREDGDRYWRVKDGSPAWVTDLVLTGHRTYHDLMLPDDWRYACIGAALEYIANHDGDAGDDVGPFADDQIDVYNGARLLWLASSLSRASYCDEAAEEGLVDADATMFDRIGAGQYLEAVEIFGHVYGGLVELADEDGADGAR